MPSAGRCARRTTPDRIKSETDHRPSGTLLANRAYPASDTEARMRPGSALGLSRVDLLIVFAITHSIDRSSAILRLLADQRRRNSTASRASRSPLPTAACGKGRREVDARAQAGWGSTVSGTVDGSPLDRARHAYEWRLVCGCSRSPVPAALDGAPRGGRKRREHQAGSSDAGRTVSGKGVLFSRHWAGTVGGKWDGQGTWFKTLRALAQALMSARITLSIAE